MLLALGLSQTLRPQVFCLFVSHPDGRVWLQLGVSGGVGLQPSQFTCREASPRHWCEVGGKSCPPLSSSWSWLALVRGR